MMGYTVATGTMNLAVQLPLYLSMVSWTVLYDTVYAKQDLEDDRKLGLNTSADFRSVINVEICADATQIFNDLVPLEQ